MAKTAKKKAATPPAARTHNGATVHLMHPEHPLEDCRAACDVEAALTDYPAADQFVGLDDFKHAPNQCPDCLALIVEMEAGYVQNIMRGQGHLPHV